VSGFVSDGPTGALACAGGRLRCDRAILDVMAPDPGSDGVDSRPQQGAERRLASPPGEKG
jgi:hypothetical protein